MAITHFIAGQCRQPRGRFGRMLGWIMNRGNTHENDWTLRRLDIAPTDHMLEVGFGPGLTIHKLAAMAPAGKISGIDFSPTMLDQASRRNARYIAAGRVDLQLGDVAALPYADALFDKAFCVNVVYFWPDPAHCLRELYRVLKPHGRVAICFGDKTDMQRMKVAREDFFRFYDSHEMVALLTQAGFQAARCETLRVPKGHYHCAMGEKA